MLSKKVAEIRRKSKLVQWKNSYSVVDWFKKLENKEKAHFIVFDIVNYYPSISQEILQKSINWAKNFVEFSENEVETIMETKKSFLVMKGQHWSKKGEENFDVAQGSFDSAECSDLVGLFLLSELEKENLSANLGLYRDDGLGITTGTPKQNENMKKAICKVFRNHGLEVTATANQKKVQFLDIELDLTNQTFSPYIKKGDIPLYVHKNSNHPKSVTRNIPKAVNKRLSALSSNQEIFDKIAPIFQEALKKSGYNYKLTYKPNDEPQKRKNRSSNNRVKCWFNPPYSIAVKTNVGKKFLQLINKHFPKQNPLSKLINRKKVKMSYRNTPNLKKQIASHNSKILRENEGPQEEIPCNCRKKEECPLKGKCQTPNIIYQATITQQPTTPENDQPVTHTYVGLATSFKERFRNHTKSINHRKYSKETKLSRKIWQLKDEGSNFELRWKILARAQPFSPITGVCGLCTEEKWHILFRPNLASLNKREEIAGHCFHKAPALLKKS